MTSPGGGAAPAPPSDPAALLAALMSTDNNVRSQAEVSTFNRTRRLQRKEIYRGVRLIVPRFCRTQLVESFLPLPVMGMWCGHSGLRQCSCSSPCSVPSLAPSAPCSRLKGGRKRKFEFSRHNSVVLKIPGNVVRGSQSLQIS